MSEQGLGLIIAILMIAMIVSATIVIVTAAISFVYKQITELMDDIKRREEQDAD